MIYLVRRGNRLYYGMYPGLLVVAENQVQGGGTEYGANAGHHRHHNAVVPLFLIHLVSHAAPDAEIDDKQTGHNRRQHHQPGCRITDQLLGSLDDLAVLHPSGISRCGHKKRGGKCGNTNTHRPDSLFQPARRLVDFLFHSKPPMS